MGGPGAVGVEKALRDESACGLVCVAIVKGGPNRPTGDHQGDFVVVMGVVQWAAFAESEQNALK